MASAGLNGAAIALGAGGAVIWYSGIKNAGIADTLRALVKGQPVTGSATGSVASVAEAAGQEVAAAVANSGGSETSAAGGEDSSEAIGDTQAALNAAIAADVRKYLGDPYATDAAGPSKFDCSGLVTWVLHHDLGLTLPSNTHTVTGQFYTWKGAATKKRAECIAGDLVCWAGHIGIAISNSQFINAPTLGENVKISTIWKTPAPLIRRVKPQ